MIEYNIAKEYSQIPGPRYVREGKFSGEDFRDSILLPLIKKAKQHNDRILIILDGGYGYPTSFLEEAFGGVIRATNDRSILSLIEFISDEEPALIDEIKLYMSEAANLLV